jgi:hypothetical protein
MVSSTWVVMLNCDWFVSDTNDEFFFSVPKVSFHHTCKITALHLPNCPRLYKYLFGLQPGVVMGNLTA